VTKQEILEYAAKAKGLKGVYIEDGEYEWYSEGILYTDENDCNYSWNPWDDSLDALELAIDCGITFVYPPPGQGNYVVTSVYGDFGKGVVWSEGGNKYDMVRQAITLTACNTGKDMD
jgi:hypothetical protein